MALRGGYAPIGVDSSDTGCAAAGSVIKGGAKVGAVVVGVPSAAITGGVCFIPGFLMDMICAHCPVGCIAAVCCAKTSASAAGSVSALGGGAVGGILSTIFCAPCAFFGCKPPICDSVNQAVTLQSVLTTMSNVEDSLNMLVVPQAREKWFSPPRQVMS